MSEGNWSITGSSPSNKDELLAPLHIGNYRLVRRLGDGGMGIVYEAVQDRPSRTVALKLMRQAVMTREQLHRFERESQLLGSLVHPNIAQVYEAGTHKEGSLSIPFYAMELVPDAKSVTEYANDRSLSRRDRIGLMIQICSAVQYAHDHAILHRDLKPNNVLVGSAGSAKVIDLGVSRLMSEASITLTRSDQLIGTIQYMAPEQVSGTQDAPSVLWDVYSLGVVLYELLVGQLPYRLPTDNALRAARFLEEAIPVRPRSIDPTISKDLESVILKALAKDPRHRYASVGALQSDLQNVLDEKPVEARSASFLSCCASRAKRLVRTYRVLVTLLTMLLWFLACVTAPVSKLIHPLDSRWPAFALRQLNHVSDQPFEQVRMVAIKSDLSDVAAALGQTDFDPTNRRSARPVIGAVVAKIAAAGPKAIALDLSFAAPSPFDARMLASFRQAEQAGVPIITAAGNWTSRGGPGVLPELAIEHRVGMPVTAVINEQIEAPMSMLIDEFDGDEAGFVMQVLAAAKGIPRDAKLSLDLQQRVRAQTADNPVIARISLLHGGPGKDALARGFAVNIPEMPPDAVLLASELSFEDILEMDASALSAAFAGRVVMIGDARPDHDALVPVLPGRNVIGYQLNSAAIDQALTDQVVHFPAQLQIANFGINAENAAWIVAFCLMAVTACLVRSTRQMLIVTTTFGVMALLVPLAAYQMQGLLLNSPATPLLLVLITPLLFTLRRGSARQSL